MGDFMSERALTEEEHEARAMLLGMRYHHGNGAPVYYKMGADGIPDTMSFIDAETLEPLVERMPSGRISINHGKGKEAHNAIWYAFGAGKL
jgi:hypothetical protein